MGKYTCFHCPEPDWSEKSLEQPCPKCGRPYGFPLSDAPAAIAAYSGIQPLSRGFYAAAYVVQRGVLRRKRVLKVIPKRVAERFNKDFEAECVKHLSVAEGTEHIVKIEDVLESDVSFGELTLPCHIAEMDYVDGLPLSRYIGNEAALTASIATQIAIDLLRLLDELQKKRVNHNDLHADNLIVATLVESARRANVVDSSVRLVAIDLGSVAEESRSDSAERRRGDLRWIATHLHALSRSLLRDPDRMSDLNNRVANALLVIGQSISADVAKQRMPSLSELGQQIETAYFRQPQHWRPWREPHLMRTFSASYNAQTMQPWHVPHLLVDPEEQWQNRIRAPGPQVVTGMRGCGKTMLLRSLQFHARAARLGSESDQEILQRLAGDRYVGLFVSAQRLLDTLGGAVSTPSAMFARLFVAYALEAVRAVEHLRDLDQDRVSALANKVLGEVVEAHVNGASDIAMASSEHDLEGRLSRLALDVALESDKYSLGTHPSTAFPALAKAVQACASIWSGTHVLFLLDDVSTRYLTQQELQNCCRHFCSKTRCPHSS